MIDRVILERPASPGLSIGVLARLTGVNAETIRYYEREHVLPEPSRGNARYRVYAQIDVERLLFVRRARDLGFTLDEVRELISLSDEPNRSCADVDALARAHLVQVEAKIAQLHALQLELSRVIGECGGGQAIADCRILRALGARSGDRSPVSSDITNLARSRG